ncbi:MAG: hypothetical protein MUC47_05925 [Candidatus Kapabacteria bacterium]|jgi:hypothetical protein|nr:hypothetical protein [Candidatus Kapabacteria bacterium]
MNPLRDDLYVYSPESLLAQAAEAEEHLGYRILTFYIDGDGIPAKQPTPHKGTFFYSPSGGTLRDEHMNIVVYSAKFDLYKGLGKA